MSNQFTVKQLIEVLKNLPNQEIFVSIGCGSSGYKPLTHVDVRKIYRSATSDSDLASTVAHQTPYEAILNYKEFYE